MENESRSVLEMTFRYDMRTNPVSIAITSLTSSEKGEDMLSSFQDYSKNNVLSLKTLDDIEAALIRFVESKQTVL